MTLIDSYFENCKLIVLDIETTGLDPGICSIILVGIRSIPIDRSLPSESAQFFCEDLRMERQLLEFIINNVADADLIITYNGASFDIPFINKRLIKLGFEYQIPDYKNFDLYKIFRSSYLKSFLPNLKQKTLEIYLGIGDIRADKISGYESVLKYQEYLKTGSEILKSEIILHNSDDIIQLEKLLSLLKKIDVHKALFSYGFPVVYENKKIYIDKVKLKTNSLNIKGHYFGFSRDSIHFAMGYSLVTSKSSNSLNIEIPLYWQAGHCFLDISELNLNMAHGPELGLEKLPGFVNNFMILTDGNTINYNEVNQIIKIICKDILFKI